MLDALFGTDGIRGTTEFTNEHRSRKLTPELALRIGQAVGWALTPSPGGFAARRKTPLSTPSPRPPPKASGRGARMIQRSL